MPDEHSTFPDDAPPFPAVRRARRLRRIGLAVLIGILVLGLANLLGVRVDTVSATGGGYELRVTYPAVSRPGLTTPWTVQVRRAGGFDGPVTIGVTGAYLAMFDRYSLYPEPSSMTSAENLVLMAFDPPPGDELTVSLDGRLEATTHIGRRAETVVLSDGARVVAVDYFTRVMP